MFTGIVREVGRIASISGGPDGFRVGLDAPDTARGAALGDSVAINGVCLTVTERDGEVLSFDAVPETISRTTLARLEAGMTVNVEPSLRAGEPLGGHLVQGHVDGIGKVLSVRAEGEGARIEIEAPAELDRYLVEKGSIGVDGVSLTVAGIEDDRFAMALVPHTLAVTTLGRLAPGDEVNLEVDVLAKYVERMLTVLPRG